MKSSLPDITGGQILEVKGKYVARIYGTGKHKTLTIWIQDATLREFLRFVLQAWKELKPNKLIIIDERKSYNSEY